VKLSHSPKVGGRKSGCTGERPLQITREPIDHAITPTQRCLLLPNRGSDVPVQAHEFSVDGARRRRSCSADTGGQLADESGVVEGDGSLAVHGFNFTTLSDHRAATEGGECRKDKDVIDETPAA
jgi:hypothetical protein